MEVDQKTLPQLRKEIDVIDHEIILALSKRVHCSEAIGQYKKSHHLNVIDMKRWHEVLKTRIKLGESLGLSKKFILELFKIIHQNSIQRQELTP